MPEYALPEYALPEYALPEYALLGGEQRESHKTRSSPRHALLVIL